jgi:hypothetical protein
MARLRPLALLVAAACGSAPSQPPPERVGDPLPPPLPDTTGWGVHALALARADDGTLWVGTYGRGIYVLRADTRDWQQVAAAPADSGTLRSPVNSIAFTESGDVWYGTVGAGFGRSTDDGVTWRTWGQAQLGPQWQYVAPHGIATAGDTVFIATADGLRVTRDSGASWLCIGAVGGFSGGSAGVADACDERIAGLPTEYLLSLAVGDGKVWVGHLQGISMSGDGGRTWSNLDADDGVPRERFRALAFNRDSTVWAASESAVYVDSAGEGRFVPFELTLPGLGGLPGAPRALIPSPGLLPPSIATSYGLAVGDGGAQFRMYYLAAGDAYRPAADMWDMTWWGPPLWPIGASSSGLNRILAGEGRIAGQARAPAAAASPAEARHTWFRRPIANEEGNPYIDATYRYGATLGGRLGQQHGVVLANPAGTAVRAIGEGVVVSAGPDATGSNTVAILHDRRWENQYVYSTYRHNASVDVGVGQRVSAGDIVARAGNTGGAPGDRVRLEVHVAPTADSTNIIDPAEAVPTFAVNPQLWLEPLPGTGIVAGRVTDSNDQLVVGARIYGLVLPYPEETPHSFTETYGAGARSDPAYEENFAVGDVPAGEYRLAVMIGGARVWRRITVEAGRVTFVEIRP